MATSGTYAFTMTRDDIIGAALRLTTRFSADDVIPALEITNCAQALDLLCKEMITEGLPLWCVKQYAVPMVANTATYNLSTITGTTLPQKVLDAFVRTPSGNDTILTPISRYDYNMLGMKTAQGTPNQYYYDPQLGAGVLTVYNVPIDATNTIYVTVQRQIQDAGIATSNPDFPQEAFRMLKWCLADEVALDYGTPERVMMKIERRAAQLRDGFFAYEQENAPVVFSPNMSQQGSHYNG